MLRDECAKGVFHEKLRKSCSIILIVRFMQVMNAKQSGCLETHAKNCFRKEPRLHSLSARAVWPQSTARGAAWPSPSFVRDVE